MVKALTEVSIKSHDCFKSMKRMISMILKLILQLKHLIFLKNAFQEVYPTGALKDVFKNLLMMLLKEFILQ